MKQDKLFSLNIHVLSLGPNVNAMQILVPKSIACTQVSKYGSTIQHQYPVNQDNYILARRQTNVFGQACLSSAITTRKSTQRMNKQTGTCNRVKPTKKACTIVHGRGYISFFCALCRYTFTLQSSWFYSQFIRLSNVFHQ